MFSACFPAPYLILFVAFVPCFDGFFLAKCCRSAHPAFPADYPTSHVNVKWMNHFYSRWFRTAERTSLEFCHFLNPSLVLVIRLCALTGLVPLPYAGRICLALMYPQGGFGPKSKRLKSIIMMPNFLFVMLTAPYAYHFGASLKISTPFAKPSFSKVSHMMPSIML